MMVVKVIYFFAIAGLKMHMRDKKVPDGLGEVESGTAWNWSGTDEGYD